MAICRRKIMKSTTIRPDQKMWRTLVRVDNKLAHGVGLFIPGLFGQFGTNFTVFCPRKAIPPTIFETMKEGKRYHVGCNIGCQRVNDLCFDGWEAE